MGNEITLKCTYENAFAKTVIKFEEWEYADPKQSDNIMAKDATVLFWALTNILPSGTYARLAELVKAHSRNAESEAELVEIEARANSLWHENEVLKSKLDEFENGIDTKKKMPLDKRRVIIQTRSFGMHTARWFEERKLWIANEMSCFDPKEVVRWWQFPYREGE